ncbi:hypothetical protein ES319_A05G356000v1 [Gossypium barbadense]|uniref:Uncharacterized protein n=3 Tax=Gossypium TaxID=3633 RepID=A0A5J5VYR9_GOSBA|nr:hypothetical protein ES319_A05G356000v1 [Gossypium barbadense]TYH19736.1 hypothetical protein ES288_A05G376000v1 [Gossypium darwinii]TYI30345.1 hypothetical protein ES332_A05G380700v1 [Gossypium tomentosum]
MNLMADGAQMAIRSCQRKPHPRRFGAWPAMAYGGGDVARGDPEGTKPSYGCTEAVHGSVGCGAPKEPRVSKNILILGNLSFVLGLGLINGLL